MRILVFGGSGMLGHKLVQRLGRGFEVWCTLQSGFDRVERYGIFAREHTLENIDVTDITQVRAAIEQASPDVVINAVGLIKQVPAANEVHETAQTGHHAILQRDLSRPEARGPRRP